MHKARNLGSVLDTAPLCVQQGVALLKSLAVSLQAIHESGDRWDQSALRVLVTEEFAIKSIGTISGLRSELPPGRIDVHKDYLAPEYITLGTEDHRADLWAWGNVAYEALTGRRPFAGKTVQDTMTALLNSEAIPLLDLNPACSRALGDIITKTLQRDPFLRFQSADELVDALNLMR
jgi:serine/threonine protein kinase